MSTTVDSRVVEMRFDNQNFERNVGHTMSTLEKLKQKLNLTGASKGLENINSAAKNVNMTGLGSAVETVSAKFSALQVMGVTALANITNSAVNAGKRMVSALTIDPIKTGFQEYETQINATQTILANTASKGSTIEDVNKALAELNTYADKTIYNFTEMTRNIGTFTAAGIDLDTSVNAIQGIANLAAVSGSTSQQASTAMYQLSQALAAGKVQLMDWNSVVNAGMGGEMFQNALRETSELLGTGAEAAIKAKGSFRESLREGWLTAEVLTETLKKFTTTGANEYIAEYTGLTKDAVAAEIKLATETYGEAEAIEYAAKALAKKSGKNEEEIKQALQFAKNAEDAATKVKTFSQLWDVMKESAQSGWSQTWKLIVGDFEQAKNLLTPLADFLTGAINKFSEARNKILESALGRSFENIGEAIKSITDPIQNSADSIGEVVDSVKNYAGVVDEIIGGKWGNGQERWDKLAEAGYDWAHAQNLVNEKLGSSVRHATDYKEAQEGVAKAQADVSKSNAEYIAELAVKSKEELKELGLQEHQIMALKTLQHQSEKTGIPIKDLAENIDLLNGRTLLMNGFKNVGMAIVNVFKAMKKGWEEIFPPKSTEAKAQALYDLIAAFHKFTTHLNLIDDETGEFTETGDKLVRVFRGIFAIVDIVTTILGGGLKLAFKAVGAVLKYFGMDVLDLAAYIGDIAVKIRDFVDDVLNLDGVVAAVIPVIQNGIEAAKGWVGAFLELPMVQNIIKNIKDALMSLKDIDVGGVFMTMFSAIQNGVGVVKEWVSAFLQIPLVQKAINGLKSSITGMVSVGSDIITGLINGLRDGTIKVPQMLEELGIKLLEAIEGVLGIESPSKEMHEVGTNVIDGLLNGLKERMSSLIALLKDVGTTIKDKISEVLGNIDFGQVFAVLASAGIFVILKKIADAFASFASIFGSASDFMDKVGKGLTNMLNSTASAIKSFSLSIKAKALKNIAIALAILVGSLVVLTFIDTGKLWAALGVLAGLAGVLAILSIAVGKFGSSGTNTGKLSAALLGISGALLLMALAVKLVGGLDPDQATQGFKGLAKMVLAIAGVLAVFGLLVKGKSAQNIDKVGGMLVKMSLAMILMVFVCKLAGKLNETEIAMGLGAISVFLAFVLALTAISLLAGKKVDKIGGMLLKISLAMALMVIVFKMVGRLKAEEVLMGIGAMGLFLAFVLGLVALTQLAGPRIDKVGSMVLKVSAALLILAFVAKIMGSMEWDEMRRAAMGLTMLTAVVAGLVAITHLIGPNPDKIAGTLLAMSLSIGILAAIAILLGMIPLENLVKGVIAIAALGGVMTAMIWATRGASDCKDNILMMAVAIGVMGLVVAVLSMIDPKKLAGATIAIGMLMGIFTGLIYVAGKASGSIGPLIVMTVAVAAFGGILYLLRDLPVQSVLSTAAALSLLMLAMSGAFFIISKASSVSRNALISVAVMTLVVAALGGVLYLLRDLPVQSVLATAASLSLLLLAMSASLLIIGISGAAATAALPAVIVMTLVIAGLGVILYLMRDLPIENTMTNAAALSTLLLAMSASLVILGVVGLMAPAVMAGLAALGILIVGLTAVLLLFAGLNKLVPDLQTFLDTGMAILEQLGYALGSFFGNIVSGLVDGMGDSLAQLGSQLSAFMTNAMPFIEGIKMVDASVLLGVGFLTSAVVALTAADLISGIASFLQGGSSFATLGTELSSFLLNAMPFIIGIKMIDPAAAEGAKALGEMILAVTAASVIDGIASFITGGSSLASFAEQILPFGEAMVAFSSTVAGNIDTAAVEAAANAGKIMAEMQSSLTGTGGVVQWFCGEKDMALFGSQLVAFGGQIVLFSQTVSANGGVNIEAVEAAANAGKIMAEMQNSIVGTGGVVQFFTGEKDMSLFGSQLVSFGASLVLFSQTVSMDGGINTEAIEAAANAGSIMTNLQSSIEPTGGVVDFFTGTNDLSTFGTQLVSFGSAIVQFSAIVSGKIDTEAIQAAANAATLMSNVQAAIPENKWLDGKQSIDDFGDDLADFGESLVAYSDEVININTTAVSSSINATGRLVQLVKNLVGLDMSGVKDFKVKSLGEALKGYSDKVAELNYSSISASITSISKLVKAINSMGDINLTSVGSFKAAINSLSTVSLDGVVKAFGNSKASFIEAGVNMVTSIVDGMKTKQSTLTNTAKSMMDAMVNSIKSTANKFATLAKVLMTRFIVGITGQKTKLTNAFNTALQSGYTTARGYYSKFYSAGGYLVSGFASGISANTFKAEAKAAAMAAAAYEAAKEALDINSPSKVFRSLGYSVPEGFAMGIDKLSGMASDSAVSMADASIDGVRNSMNRISDMINGDLNTQPTIRPVLDLSDVKSGAGSIAGMFNSGIGLSANLNAVSSAMGRRNQNGGNSDIVSAIDKLRKDVGNLTNTTYSINGVTYDDGSNIANAISTITRAARIERRI